MESRVTASWSWGWGREGLSKKENGPILLNTLQCTRESSSTKNYLVLNISGAVYETPPPGMYNFVCGEVFV